MGEYVPGFHKGRGSSTAVEAVPCDVSLIAGYVIGPVFEPEVARTRKAWWRRLIARRRTPAAVVQQVHAGEIDPLVPSRAEAAVAARQAAEVISAAMARLRVEAALAGETREEKSPERLRLFPEHLLIGALVVVTLGNAIWHFLG